MGRKPTTCPHDITPKRNCRICRNIWKRKYEYSLRGKTIRLKWKENHRGKRKEWNKNCRLCGNPFNTIFAHQEFCSSECRYKNYKNSESYRNGYLKNNLKNSHRTRDYYRRLKKRFIEQKGCKCEICGYSKCISALEFHHKEELNKSTHKRNRFENPLTKSFDLDKVILVCSNCHREIHNNH